MDDAALKCCSSGIAGFWVKPDDVGRTLVGAEHQIRNEVGWRAHYLSRSAVFKASRRIAVIAVLAGAGVYVYPVLLRVTTLPADSNIRNPRTLRQCAGVGDR